MKAKQFEVWIADLNPTIGTEAGKIRPVVIIQTDLLNKLHPSTIICPLTTNIRMDANILRIHLPKDSCGLEQSCDIMIDQVRTIDNKRLVRKVGNIPVELVRTIKENLKIVLDLE